MEMIAESPLRRGAQRELLFAMRDVYPGRLLGLPSALATDERLAHANLLYLAEHGLCESGLTQGSSGGYRYGRGARITAKGLDFLEDDGGLSAIFGLVTVKLHADTIRDLIAERVEAASIPDDEKSNLRRVVASLPEVALRSMTRQLVENGLSHLPDAVHWLRSFGLG